MSQNWSFKHSAKMKRWLRAQNRNYTEGPHESGPLKFAPGRGTSRIFSMQVLASQLHFLANKNAKPTVPSFFWPINCIEEIGGHVALLSGPNVYWPYCATNLFFSNNFQVRYQQVNRSYHHVGKISWMSKTVRIKRLYI